MQKSFWIRHLATTRHRKLLQNLQRPLQVTSISNLCERQIQVRFLNFIQDEHPQTIAMILSYLSSAQAAMILGALTPEKQADVAKRIAMMDRTSPDVIKGGRACVGKRNFLP